MSADRPKPVIFTDLDATLLDHHDYSWAVAADALTALAAREIPVCIITSKTVAEIRVLREQLGNRHPFAAENGGVVAVPAGYFGAQSGDNRSDGHGLADEPLCLTTLGADYAMLRQLAVDLRERHGYRYIGFGDMDAAAVAKATGLMLEDADLARQRSASEPLLWADSERARKRFAEQAEAAGMTTREGGRFVHLLGRATKGDALNWLRDQFTARHGAILAVALGDSGNDADMLAAADIGYWVAQADGSYYAPPAGSIRHAGDIGPAGWTRAIGALIDNNEI